MLFVGDIARTARTAATFVASPHSRRESTQNKRASKSNNRLSQGRASQSNAQAYMEADWELTEQVQREEGWVGRSGSEAGRGGYGYV